MKSVSSKAITLGIISTLFFAVTFVLNRSMSVQGGSWMWSAALRYLFMLPILLIIVSMRGNLKQLWIEMRRNIGAWILWSTIGFGIFYAALTFASDFGPSWLVASTWEITIIAGILIAPLLEPKTKRKGFPKSALFFSAIILIGIAIMQWKQAQEMNVKTMLLGAIPALIGAFAYPLGNRMMMKVTDGRVDAFQRTLGMTIACMPFWIIISVLAYAKFGIPSTGQLSQSFIIAVFSGVIATAMFFKATDMVKNNADLLASVEATQACEILFALLGEMMILGGVFPDMFSLFGIVLVLFGMVLHSIKRKPVT